MQWRDRFRRAYKGTTLHETQFDDGWQSAAAGWAGEVIVEDQFVLYDVDEKVGIVTLNRPDKLNAISHELHMR